MQIVSRQVARGLVFLASAAVLGATLFPSNQPGGNAPLCILCGDRGLADALVNVCLFLPLGAAIALLGGSTRRALLVSALLSIGVEAAQYSLIPGRDSSLGDLLFNTLGGAAGVLAVRTLPLWLKPPQQTAARLSLAAGLFALALVAVTGLLNEPLPTSDTYYVSWTPELAHLEHYDGHVHSASMGGLPVDPGEKEPIELKRLVQERAAIEVHVTAGSQVNGPSALVSIHDRQRREIMLLGPDRDRLVFRVRTWAAFFRLDQPDFRAYGVFHDIQPGQNIVVTARPAGRSYCLGIEPEVSCASALTAGSGWGLFFFGEAWPQWFHTTLNSLWIAALSFPIGLWLRPRWESILACGFLALAVIAMPVLVHLENTPPAQFFGALAGMLAGVAIARAVRDTLASA